MKEYKVLGEIDRNKLEEELNRYGAQGWSVLQLVSFQNAAQTFLFTVLQKERQKP